MFGLLIRSLRLLNYLNNHKKDVMRFMVKQIGINIALLAFSIFMLVAAFQLDSGSSIAQIGPAYYPKLILYVLIGLNLIDIVLKFIQHRQETEESEEESETTQFMWKRFLILIPLLVLYVFSLDWLDYRISTFVFVLIIMLMIDMKNYKRAIVASLGFVIAIYVVFDYLLRIPMP